MPSLRRETVEKENAARMNCCRNGEHTLTPLKPVNQEMWDIVRSARFQKTQKTYNGVFSFTAFDAGGVEKQTWTQPVPPSMLRLARRAYHRIFDLQERYEGTNLSTSSRFYVYDSEFDRAVQNHDLNDSIARTLQTDIHEKIPWIRHYRSAVNYILNSDEPSLVNSGLAYVEFATVSRVNDGADIGQQIDAQEIAASVFTSNEARTSGRTVVTYPINSPDSKPRFLPLWVPTYEPLLLFLTGESG